MLRLLFRFTVVLLPLYPFALATEVVMEWMGSGRTVHGILLLLACLAALALIEGLLFHFWLLPAWGQAISERLYGGSYLPEEDNLALLAARIRKSEDAALLPEMRRLVLTQHRRTRGWLELARLQQDVAHDHPAALQTLLEGADSVSDREDRAMLLYRAAMLASTHLQADSRAEELFSRAARLYPRTVYGKRAAEKNSL